MKKSLFFLFIVLILSLAACSKTEIIKIGADGEVIEEASEEVMEEKAEEVVEEKTEEVMEEVTGSAVKKAVSCDDTDGNDVESSGRVTVEYDDGSTEDFYDECPVPNERFITEYVCDGNNVKPINSFCDDFCVTGAGVCFS